MIDGVFPFLGFYISNSVFLSFLSCLVWSYISYLYYFVVVVLMLLYLALRFACGFLRPCPGTCSAWRVLVRFPFGRSCL